MIHQFRLRHRGVWPTGLGSLAMDGFYANSRRIEPLTAATIDMSSLTIATAGRVGISFGL